MALYGGEVERAANVPSCGSSGLSQRVTVKCSWPESSTPKVPELLFTAKNLLWAQAKVGGMGIEDPRASRTSQISRAWDPASSATPLRTTRPNYSCSLFYLRAAKTSVRPKVKPPHGCSGAPLAHGSSER